MEEDLRFPSKITAKKRNMSIKLPDAIIAATALKNNWTLVTRKKAKFGLTPKSKKSSPTAKNSLPLATCPIKRFPTAKELNSSGFNINDSAFKINCGAVIECCQ
jgi:hypothetical protein